MRTVIRFVLFPFIMIFTAIFWIGVMIGAVAKMALLIMAKACGSSSLPKGIDEKSKVKETVVVKTFKEN